MISQGFRATADFTDPTVIWVPKQFSLVSVENAWKALEYPKSLLNTVIIEIVSAMLEVVMCSITAYGLSRFKFKGSKFLNNCFMAGLFINVNYIVVPIFLMLSNGDTLLRKLGGEGFLLNNFSV